MKTIRNALIASLLAGGSLSAMAADTAKQASIPFLNLSQSIHSWQARGQDGLWIQDMRKQWYFAELQAPCNGLEFAVRLGFETRTNNTLDRFGTVIVPNEARCQITSLVKSDAPPDEKKNRKVDAAAAK